MTSREYLQRALECARLSQNLPDAISRDSFAAMAKTWIKLAEAERAEALVEGDDHERKRGHRAPPRQCHSEQP
jgi:hypothetical protein